jgi:putative resolvase
MEKTITIAKAAELLGVTVKTLQRWDREGRLVPLTRTHTNRRVYTLEQVRMFQGLRAVGHAPSRVIAYCRVSSQAQKPDLQNQQRALEQFAAARGFANLEVITEVGGRLKRVRLRRWSLPIRIAWYDLGLCGLPSLPLPMGASCWCSTRKRCLRNKRWSKT